MDLLLRSSNRMTLSGLRLYVGTVVKNGNGVLLVRQSPGHPLEGHWTIPWGAVESNESAASAALRETMEEGGIEAEIEALLGVQELPPPQDGCTAIVYLCKHLSGTPAPQDQETDAARYFSPEEFASLAEPIEPWTEWLVYRVFSGKTFAIPSHPDNPLRARGSFV